MFVINLYFYLFPENVKILKVFNSLYPPLTIILGCILIKYLFKSHNTLLLMVSNFNVYFNFPCINHLGYSLFLVSLSVSLVYFFLLPDKILTVFLSQQILSFYFSRKMLYFTFIFEGKYLLVLQYWLGSYSFFVSVEVSYEFHFCFFEDNLSFITPACKNNLCF